MSLTLASIHLYPVKSLGGFAVQAAHLTDRGLLHDRRWMLVDRNGRFISQREVPSMACLHCAPNEDGFTVTDIRDGSTLAMPWTIAEGAQRSASVWDDALMVIEDVSDRAAWFRVRLGVELGLVFMPDESERPTDLNYADATTSLSDGFPYLIISQASLDELNTRIDPIPMDRFRPNLVIDGGIAFQEDTWRSISMGNSAFDLVKPCARCVITTTDQRTGERNKEPLATLAGYRRRVVGGAWKVDFGMNAVATSGTSVHVGDAVRVITQLVTH